MQKIVNFYLSFWFNVIRLNFSLFTHAHNTVFRQNGHPNMKISSQEQHRLTFETDLAAGVFMTSITSVQRLTSKP